MHRVLNVKAEPDFVLVLTFDDGLIGRVSIRDRLFGQMFEPLRDPAMFAQVSVDQFGAVCWPNQADLAPDGLYLQVKAQA